MLGFSHIGGEECRWLERAIEAEEVKREVKGCADDKARGPDDFTLAFFQHYWNKVKANMMDSVVEFQEMGEFEKSLSASFVVIIPKRKGTLSMKDYKPISLVGSIYKIITKVLSITLRRSG